MKFRDEFIVGLYVVGVIVCMSLLCWVVLG
jgi:hypothetical protein